MVNQGDAWKTPVSSYTPQTTIPSQCSIHPGQTSSHSRIFSHPQPCHLCLFTISLICLLRILPHSHQILFSNSQLQVISLLQSCPSNRPSPLLTVLSWNINLGRRQSGWNRWHNSCCINNKQWINIGYGHSTRPLVTNFCLPTEWGLYSFAEFTSLSKLAPFFLDPSSPKHTYLTFTPQTHASRPLQLLHGTPSHPCPPGEISWCPASVYASSRQKWRPSREPLGHLKFIPLEYILLFEVFTSWGGAFVCSQVDCELLRAGIKYFPYYYSLSFD